MLFDLFKLGTLLYINEIINFVSKGTLYIYEYWIYEIVFANLKTLFISYKFKTIYYDWNTEHVFYFNINYNMHFAVQIS